jgi:hypothetical protein
MASTTQDGINVQDAKSSSGKTQDIAEAPLHDSDDDKIPTDSQAGVRAVEAAATVWTRGHLVAAYAM